MSSKKRKIVFSVSAIVLLLLLIFGLLIARKLYSHEKWQSNYIFELQKQINSLATEFSEAEVVSTEGTIESTELLPTDFYEKLNSGIDVNILVVGDSIGHGDGASDESKKWTSLLQNWIQDSYGVDCTINNISMPGNTSYAGYGRIAVLDDDTVYDLAIICYGQNDDNEGFAENYESMIRALYSKFEKIDIISILEHSQRTYTEKMQKIQALCAYYSIPVADTIAVFDESGYEYDDLVVDGIHPNDLGYQYYFSTVAEIIGEQTGARAYSSWVYDPSSAVFCSASDFTRVDEYTWEIEIHDVRGKIGLYWSIIQGEQSITVTIDDKKTVSQTINWEHDYDLMCFREFSKDDFEICRKVKIEFDSKAAADGFYGMLISDVEYQ